MTDDQLTDEERFDRAVQILLDSAIMSSYLATFWAYCDGFINEDDLRDGLR